MKKLALLLALVTALQISAQTSVTAELWQKDLRFLQKIVHGQFPFLFKKVTAAEFDKEIEEFYKVIPSLQEHEIVVGFSRIIALFKYGHTRMGYGSSPVPFHHIPIDFYEFKDGLYIKSAHKEHKRIVGAKIVALQGVPIDKVLQLVAPTVPIENSQFFKAYGLNNLTFPEVLHAQGVTDSLLEAFTLTLEKEGEQFEYSLASTTDADAQMKYGELVKGTDWVDERDTIVTPYYLKNLEKTYYYEYLPEEKTVYVRHSRIRNDASENVADFYTRVLDFIDNNDVEKLVLDVRLNGGGNNFLNKPIIQGIIKNEKINIRGKFFVITGRRTFSAAQSLINELDNYTNVLFVGEPSSENINFYGDNKRVILPSSGLPVYLSFAWWQDKPQWENADFIAPHYPVEMTYSNYIQNQDVVLQRVLDFSADNFTLEPEAYLLELYEEKGYDEVVAQTKKMITNTAYSFYDFQTEFDNQAYILLGNNNEKALMLFNLNTNLFPKDPNTWYNLAQAHRELNNSKESNVYYKKVIRLDPTHRLAEKAKNYLKN